MPLSLRMGPRQFTILKNLGDGNTDWEDLTFEEKELAYVTGIDLTDTVDPQKIQEFERRREIHQAIEDSGPVGSAINRARLALM